MNIRKATCVVLAVVYGLLLFFMGGLEVYYSRNLPGSPQVDTGHVYRITVNHGFVVYGTKTERQLLNADRASFPLLFAFFFAILVLRPWRNDGPFPGPKWLLIAPFVAMLLWGIASVAIAVYT